MQVFAALFPHYRQLMQAFAAPAPRNKLVDILPALPDTNIDFPIVAANCFPNNPTNKYGSFFYVHAPASIIRLQK